MAILCYVARGAHRSSAGKDAVDEEASAESEADGTLVPAGIYLLRGRSAPSQGGRRAQLHFHFSVPYVLYC